MLTSVLGLPASLVAGVIALFTVGESWAVAVVLAWIALTLSTAAAMPRLALWPIVVLQLAVLGGGGYLVGDHTARVVRALNTTTGPADPADATLLAGAEQTVREALDEAAFRIELHEAEITAVVQDGLGRSKGPLRRVVVDITDGPPGPSARIGFRGDFKSGDLTVTGTVAAVVVAGAVRIEVTSLEMGSLHLPALGRQAMEEAIAGLLEGVTDVNALLADAAAEVQSIVAGNDRIVITGVHTGGSPITSTHLLEALRDLAGKTATAAPPPERLGPGVVDGIAAEGSRYYLALGDSLAANVGVDRPALGYVSRLHRWLQARDGAGYGLRNFGVPGETSGTLIRGGQLDSAVEFMRAHRVAYISVDIGANDLLAHLAGPDCAPGLDAPSCASRIESTMAAYRGNIEEVFRRLRSAAPDATIVFLSAYNPFSLGLGTSFEAQSDAALVELNLIAAAAASRFGILVADGLTPMQGAAGTATHMLANPPDIHPTAAGHDVLAAALADAIGW